MAPCAHLRRRVRPCWPPDRCCCCSTESEDDLRHGGRPPSRYRFGGRYSIPVRLPDEENLIRWRFSQYSKNNTIELVYSEFRRLREPSYKEKKVREGGLYFLFIFFFAQQREFIYKVISCVKTQCVAFTLREIFWYLGKKKSNFVAYLENIYAINFIKC